MTKAKRIPIFVLRLMALVATTLAAIIMATSHDSATVFNVTFEAKYTNTPSFKYFVGVNAIASGYSFILLLLPLLPSKNWLWRLELVFDLVITLMLDSSISAALGIAQVGKKGDSHAGWLPICGQVPKFCDHVKGALIAGFVAAIIYFLLLLYSLHNVLNLLTITGPPL